MRTSSLVPSPWIALKREPARKSFGSDINAVSNSRVKVIGGNSVSNSVLKD